MDVLCADKTGTLTCNALELAEIVPLPGFNRERVLQLATLASSEADQDPIDTAVREAAVKITTHEVNERVTRLVPFDPARKMSEAFVVDREGNEQRVIKGAFETVAATADAPPDTASLVDDLAACGKRVLAVGLGPPQSIRVVGLIAISDPPREDASGLIATLREMGVRTVMVTGNSPVTGAAIAKSRYGRGRLLGAAYFRRSEH